MTKEKLLNRIRDNFDEETQKFTYDKIPDEILDFIISIMEKWWVDFDSDCIMDFVCGEIVNWKQWTITKLWLKETFHEDTKHLFD